MSASNKIIQAAAGNAGAVEGLYVEDVFSTYLYDGNGSSQVIENGINLGNSNSGGSAEFTGTGGDELLISSSTTLSGDFTLEAWVYKTDSAKGEIISHSTINNQFAVDASQRLEIYDGSSTLTSTGTISLNTWVHVAVTRFGSDITFWINGTSSGAAVTGATLNFDQIGQLFSVNAPWNGYLSNVRIVSGTTVYTTSFTPPTSALTAISGTELLACQGPDPISDNSSNAYTVTADGNAKASTFGPFTSDTAGEGGLTWIKSRDGARNHLFFDTERGATNYVVSNTTDGQGTNAQYLTAFNSDGFTLGTDSDVNNSTGEDYVSWTFRKAPKFFDVVTWTGENFGGGRQISHNLGSVPGTIIIKRTSATSAWYTWHRSTPNSYYTLDSTDAGTTNGTQYYFGDGSVVVAPTATEFTTQTMNENGFTYVAYLFAHNDGDGEFGETGDQDIIKCGSYTADGSGNASVNLGFEPQWLMIKSSSATENWVMIDNMRGLVVGGTDPTLYANLSNAEYTAGGGDRVDINATGFDTVTDRFNISSANESYIYIAIRRGPMKTPEDATEVFSPNAYTATGASGNRQVTGFPVDLSIVGSRNNPSTWQFAANPRITGGDKYNITSSTASEATTSTDGLQFDDNTGFSFGGASLNNSSNMISWNFQRSPGFFDVVAYEGDSASSGTGNTQVISHNLGVSPEYIIVKRRSGSSDWIHWNKDIGAANYLFGDTGALLSANPTFFFGVNGPTPTETTFTVGDAYYTNSSGSTYIAYLFATLPGVSKVGSYTGNGTSQTIDCGFTTGAKFVLIKRTDGTGDWHVFDSERGIISGNDPRLEFNTDSAEQTNADFLNPNSSGFAVTSDTAVNSNTREYIFLAIA